MARPSVFDLSVRGRVVFAAVYLFVQASLLATASWRPDGLFAFHMFNESSTIAISLARVVRQPGGGVKTVPVPVSGQWSATDGAGRAHVFAWSERVKDPILATLGRSVHAAYGVDAQLFRLGRALEDVAQHLDGDAETTALIAEVDVNRNGRDSYRARIVSKERAP